MNIELIEIACCNIVGEDRDIPGRPGRPLGPGGPGGPGLYPGSPFSPIKTNKSHIFAFSSITFLRKQTKSCN